MSTTTTATIHGLSEDDGRPVTYCGLQVDGDSRIASDGYAAVEDWPGFVEHFEANHRSGVETVVPSVVTASWSCEPCQPCRRSPKPEPQITSSRGRPVRVRK